MNREAEGNARPEHIVGVEFLIILDMVVVNFGPHKKAPPKVVTKSSAQVFHEVIAPCVIDTTNHGITARTRAEAVKARARNA